MEALVQKLRSIIIFLKQTFDTKPSDITIILPQLSETIGNS